MRFVSRICALMIGLFAVAATLPAQEQGSGAEVSGFVGTQRLLGVSKPVLGGTLGKTIGTRGLLFVEPSYVSLAEGVKLANFLGGVNIPLPAVGDRVAPYVSVVGGIARSSTFGESSLDPAFGAGVGVRVFVGPAWGIKPEFRWQRYHDSSDSLNTYVFKVGVFYRFGSR